MMDVMLYVQLAIADGFTQHIGQAGCLRAANFQAIGVKVHPEAAAFRYSGIYCFSLLDPEARVNPQLAQEQHQSTRQRWRGSRSAQPASPLAGASIS